MAISSQCINALPVPELCRCSFLLPPGIKSVKRDSSTLHTDSCKLPQDQGPCFGYETRFFYNATLMTCQEFSYGGCLGNENNFVTEKECLQSCRTEAVCRLPIQSGSCTTSTELWAFDSTSGKCVPFKYSSCQGNGNRFYTQKECEEYCGTLRDGRDSFKLSPQCILVLVVLNLLKKRETGEKIPECTWM
ncbi:Inter-alpha-trypsin inhibitor [Acipenser ruthenus]|uniref:Inter-alpha-trypsin inhibitor n=1 Tax=Acipenser ruthenus TaxID=7906 RepID=A0A444UTM7_ACIRT|nr:Inter-alpha-trypsin inhibitor [Acipenser ruthenus]